MTSLDILAFGAHPDDVEIGMGGTIAKYVQKGNKIGICNLTYAELSSNGTKENRQLEAKKAAQTLNVHELIQLSLPDRGLYISDENIKVISRVIRTYKPKVVFVPYSIDRHPDHGNCAKLVEEVLFSAKIRKFDEESNMQPHNVSKLYFYMINGLHKPDFYINISEFIHIKKEALQAYESQFILTEGSVATPLTNNYIQRVIDREKLFGTECGCDYAEGFFAKEPLILEDDLLGGA
ncbi:MULTISPECIES: bacillithiol biosynthesis deacetylase BshB1 [Bacillus]|uniref:bacillithiol biosynthesis deacetylase BshB1 n=1 Tax=Bacillus TaxID=1386 RepID=UPI000BB86592|nr:MULTISPECIES: bacillithiol biosynthesis deacetylase BshB1 [Bacillus]